MFDIGFSEILVIAVVALIVIGPERLPGVARTLGHLFGRMQRYVNDVKADIQREMELDELKKLRQSVEESAHAIEQSVTQEVNAAQQVLHDLETAANPAAELAGEKSPQTPQMQLPLEDFALAAAPSEAATPSEPAVVSPEPVAAKSPERPVV